MASYFDSRKTVTEERVRAVTELVFDKLKRRIAEKGSGSFVHRHEIMGCVQEEYHELVQASHNRDLIHMTWELEDLAVAAIFSIASIELGIDNSER